MNCNFPACMFSSLRPNRLLVVVAIVGLLSGLLLSGTPAFGLSQDEITAISLSTFTTKSANFSWNTYLNQYLNGVSAANPKYEAGLLAWGETYAAMAERAMFEATGDTYYLELLLSSGETMYANRADRVSPPLVDENRNQLMPAFISFNTNRGNLAQQHAWLVHSAFPSHPVTHAIAKIYKKPDLYAQYGARAESLTADIIETMDSFDQDFSLLSDGRGVYYEPYLDYYAPQTNGQSPYNMQNAAGMTYVALWKATGEQRFYDRAVAIAKTLKTELTPVLDRYQWRYAPYNSFGSASDVSHAGLDVSFAVDAYEAGIVFDDTDIQRLVNTMRHMHVGSGFTAAVNGAGAGTTASTRLTSLWLRLARYDASLREEVLAPFQTYWNGASGVWPMLGSALLYETGTAYQQETTFHDSFDALQLDVRWRRPSSQPIGNTWQARMSESQLIVSDIQSSATANQWIEIVRTRDVDLSTAWEVCYEFFWDSADGAADPLQAMQHFSVELRGAAGELISKVGIRDAWNQHNGRRVVELLGQSIDEPFDSLDTEGSAEIRIVSDALLEASHVFWDDVLVLSVPTVLDLAQVAMTFGHYDSSTVPSHFGTIIVESLAVNTFLPGDYNADGVVDAGDYTVWRDNLGSDFSLPGDRSPGSVTMDDYAVWKENFGVTYAALNGLKVFTVPEPSAWPMGLAASTWMFGATARLRSYRHATNRKCIRTVKNGRSEAKF